MSSREDWVLERQRQVADRLSRTRAATAANVASSSSSSSSASSSGRNRDDGGINNGGPNRWKPPPPPPSSASGGPRGGATASGVKRSLASLTGVAPKSKPTMATTAPTATATTKRSSGTGTGTHGDPIVLDGGGGTAPERRRKRPAAPPRPRSNSNGQCQKRLFSTMKRPAPPPPPSKPPSPPVETAEMALARARQRTGVKLSAESEAKMAAAAKAAARPKSSSQLKRPTMRGRNAIAAAATASQTSKAGASTAAGVARGSAAGSLSSILMSNKDTAKYLGTDAPKLLKHYRKIEPNDYWKHIREWDFLADLNDRMKCNNNGNNNGNGKRKRDGEKESAGGDNVKHAPPLPDAFDSYREYCALWSPLCLDEARAQLLSEAVSDVPYWSSKPEKKPLRVRLRPLKKDLAGTSDDIGVRVDEVLTADVKDRQFNSNDIVLLARKESYVWDATRGKLDVQLTANQRRQERPSFVGHGIVGHVEYKRRSIEGLTVQVSRELWADMNANVGAGGGGGGANASVEMVVLKLGSNVTSLREFTALCRMDSIPLLDYILGGKKMSSSEKKLSETRASLSQKKGDGGDDGDDDDVDPDQAEKRAKKEILSKMGGSSALGKGFAQYASRKFNLSQLGAISASAQQYGEGGFTLIKGPPGTGKTTTLCALLNALHIRQMNQYFGEVKKLAESFDAVVGKRASLSLSDAAKKRPRILVCAPSNAAVDNVILKIMEDGFVDGNGCRYNPSIVRIGRGQSASVKDVGLEEMVENYVSDAMDQAKLDNRMEGYKAECRRIHSDITKLRQRMNAIKKAAPYPLAKDWEIRIDEETQRVLFVNHKQKMTTYEVPPPPEPGQRHFPGEAMPEYKAFMIRVVKMVERYNNISTELERYSICRDVSNAIQRGANCRAMNDIRQQIETHILDSMHIVTTTLGTAGNRSLEAANKFEVVVIDEAAQSVEPSTLAGLQLGSSHAILVGDPQQLPATIFNVSGRVTKYDRSLFQRLEEAGHDVHLLNTQYRMHPAISDFPRRIFYDGKLMDGPNVKHPEYGGPLKRSVFKKFQAFQPFTILDLESFEERGGTSLSNSGEAQLALHLFNNLKSGTEGKSTSSRVAVITPYAQQAALLRRTFSNGLGEGYERFVEISSVDAFQGREANIVIFSCVRAAGSRGIGFLSDVRRMNVAMTRAKHFLFVIARCSSIVVNPYWRDLVQHARETNAVVPVPFTGSRQAFSFPDLGTLKAMPPQKPMVPVNRNRARADSNAESCFKNPPYRARTDSNAESCFKKPPSDRGYRV